MDDPDNEPLQNWTAWRNILRSLIPGYQSSHAPGPEITSVFPNGEPNLINDHVYEIYKPATKAVLEIVFFHGFEIGDSMESYWRDWLSEDQTHCWLKTWLVQELPKARVLSVSYDSSLLESSTTGRMDLYKVAENLEYSLIIHAEVGQKGCPVIFVGHSLGGLVMKTLCVRAEEQYRKLQCRSTHIQHVNTDEFLLANFLSNLKGMFFYATPHNGSILDETTRKNLKLTSPLAQDLEVLNKHSARLHQDFSSLCSNRKWTVSGVAEAHVTHLGNFHGVLVPEGCTRWDKHDRYATIAADHFGICKPERKESNSFTCVVDFVNRVMKECEWASCVDNLQYVPDYVVDLDIRVQKIQQLVENNRRVAIIGMGGMGKSTVVKKLFNNICRGYEYTCFFDTVKENVKESASPTELQKGILANLYCNGKKVTGEIKWCMLKETKTLFILDDVNSNDHVFDLTDFTNLDTRLIVTSRNMQFLRDFVIHEIDKLDEQRSMDLFCLHAFKDDPQTKLEEDPELKEVLKKLLLKCDGLPLALEVVGASLYRANNDVWKETPGKLERAERLGGSHKDKLWHMLETSYDVLGYEEKQMFLDVAVLCTNSVNGSEPTLREMKLYWNATLGSSETGWQHLTERCLVRTQSYLYCRVPDNDKVLWVHVWMHEHLRDLGRREVFFSKDKAEKLKPEKHSRIVLKYNDDWEIVKSSDNQGECEATALKVDAGKDVEFDVRVFSKFPNLRYLSLKGISLRGDPLRFPRQLVVLQIVDCQFIMESDPLPSPPNNLQLKNLVFLELRDHSSGDRQRLMFSILSDLGKMSKLRILRIIVYDKIWYIPTHGDVKNCINQLGNLCDLEELTLYNYSYGLDQMPKSFANLTSLQKVELWNCPQLVKLPSFANMASLQELYICGCPELEELPSFGKGSSNPKPAGHCRDPLTIRIEYCFKLRNLPHSIGNLTRLQSLKLGNCDALVSLPDSIGNLTRLQSLKLRNCDALKTLPDTLGQLKQLKHFSVYQCYSLKELPDSFTKLCSLEIAEFHHSVSTLPENMGELCALRKLLIRSAGHDIEQRLPDSLLELPNLEEFELRSCCGLDKLPAKFGALPRLLRLHLCGRDWNKQCFRTGDGSRGDTLPEGMDVLTSLEELRIESQDKLETLPPKLGQLQELKELRIARCPWLASLPESFGQLRRLHILIIWECGMLASLPDNFGELHALEELKIVGCDKKLRRLPHNFGQLRRLRILRIKGCGMLTSLPDSFGELHALEVLEIVFDKNLRRLPHNFGQLRRLRFLTIDRCGMLTHLPPDFGSLESLQVLTLCQCPRLSRLPQSFMQLSSLQELIVHTCPFMEPLKRSIQVRVHWHCKEYHGLYQFYRDPEAAPFGPSVFTESVDDDLFEASSGEGTEDMDFEPMEGMEFEPTEGMELKEMDESDMSRKVAPFGSSDFTKHAHDNSFEPSSSKQRRIR